MASQTFSKELGKYNQLTDVSSGNGRPQEKNRVLDSQDVDIIRKCEGCGKNMPRVKDSLVCACKKAIHCSMDCYKTSNHKCQQDYHKNISKNESVEIEVLEACDQRYMAGRGPSSEKIKNLVKITKGDHKKILKYAERGNPSANYVVGLAYMTREFDRGADFAIPSQYEEKSVAETNEMAVKFLKVAAEKEVPEAMYGLFRVLVSEGGLNVDRRVAHFWLDKAYNTGTMDDLIQLLEIPRDNNFPQQFNDVYDDIVECNIAKNDVIRLRAPSLTHLLLATRFRELKAWDGKTGMGKPFHGFHIFQSAMELIGELKNEQWGPSLIEGENITLLIISARPGYSDMADKYHLLERKENNVKFLHGAKETTNPDYQLVGQTCKVDGRTNHLITCKHRQFMPEEKGKWIEDRKIEITSSKQSLEDIIKNFKLAGECKPCVQEAKQRLRAVKFGEFSISLTPVLKGNHYAARYAKEDGVIVQDVFFGYNKPYMKQLLQCLMSNPPDLHPLAVAEDAKLFWPIIWFWGSVHQAVQDTCDKTTLDSIYSSLGDKVVCGKRKNASALAAFPDAAAGQWRIACGNENCVRVDHEVKMDLCAGCKVRRYCNEACQRKDWEKHMKFCKAVKKQQK